MPESKRLPKWLKLVNPLIVSLQHLGLSIGPVHILSVPGRKSGKLRTTPVSLMIVDGTRYAVGGLSSADWVKNAQAAGWGVVSYGRKTDRVALIELPVRDRPSILSQFPRLVPQGVSFFQQLYSLPKEPSLLPEAFAQLAATCSVFRLDPLPATGANK